MRCPLVLPRCIKDKKVKSLVLAHPSLTNLLNLASNKYCSSEGISKLYLQREGQKRDNKIARAFTAVIFEQLGQVEAHLGETKLEIVSWGI